MRVAASARAAAAGRTHHLCSMLVWAATGHNNSKPLDSLPWRVRGQVPQTMPTADAASAPPNYTSAVPAHWLPCTARHPTTRHTPLYGSCQVAKQKKQAGSNNPPHSLSCTPHISTAAQGGPPARSTSKVQLPDTQKLRHTLLTAKWECEVLTSMRLGGRGSTWQRNGCCATPRPASRSDTWCC